ncbi:hypothetical protein [Pseudonocardia nigra]|uniref:hypothetical protein n=1 Tax=Pseudonocardia nigra TaxID=1921578 RepID=UPI001C60481C|nr:hypothetical protein [Pseudonocardia nigra]
MRIPSKLARAAAVTVAAVGITVGVAAAPAQAAITGMSAKLTVTAQNSNDLYWVAVEGVVNMPQAEAQAKIASGHTMQLRLWGDDPSSDDLQYGPYFNGGGSGGGSGQLWAASDGLHFFRTIRLPGYKLDEDNGWYEGDGDELYVGVRFVTAGGSTLKSAETNRVHGYF